MRPPTPLPKVHIPPRFLSLACSAESAQQSTFHPPKATALRRMSQHFLERSEPLASAILHPPVEVVQFSASAWPSRLLHHRSGQRTNQQRTDSWIRSFASEPTVSSRLCPLFRACCVRLPAQGLYRRRSLKLSSVHAISSYCASMNQAIERSSLFQPASTRSMQNSQHTVCSYSEDGERAMKRR